MTKFLADIEDHATTGETPSYSLRLIISQVRTKCEKLIEIDNYLQVKMQMLARLFHKHGSLAQGDCEVSLEDMQRISQTLKERESQAITQALNNLNQEKAVLSEKESKIETLELKLRGRIAKKKEQLEQVETQYKLNQEIFQEYHKTLTEKDTELKQRDHLLRQKEEDCAKRAIDLD